MKRMTGPEYIKAAEKAGCDTRPGKGSHTVVYSPDGRERTVVPHCKDLDIGLERALNKWFKRVGILVLLLFFLVPYILYQNPSLVAALQGLGWLPQ